MQFPSSVSGGSDPPGTHTHPGSSSSGRLACHHPPLEEGGAPPSTASLSGRCPLVLLCPQCPCPISGPQTGSASATLWSPVGERNTLSPSPQTPASEAAPTGARKCFFPPDPTPASRQRPAGTPGGPTGRWPCADWGPRSVCRAGGHSAPPSVSEPGGRARVLPGGLLRPSGGHWEALNLTGRASVCWQGWRVASGLPGLNSGVTCPPAPLWACPSPVGPPSAGEATQHS